MREEAMFRPARVITTILLVAAGLAVLPAPALPQSSTGQRLFDSPEAAAKALVAAVRADDDKALIEIFGPRHADLIVSAGRVHRENRARFIKAVDEYRFLRHEADGRITVLVGYEAWAFPIPLVKEASRWRFDTDAGREEFLNRRVGANELATIETLRAYVDAQRLYASKPRDGSNVRQFARKVRSTPGKQDGLYWDADPAKGEEPSPVGPLIDEARGRRPGDPYNGYYFKILTRQGPAAAAGPYNYVINGRMIGGFAMVAYPADYARSGVKTFIINHYGVVYERDLGPNTAKIATAITEYNPDGAWKPVED